MPNKFVYKGDKKISIQSSIDSKLEKVEPDILYMDNVTLVLKEGDNVTEFCKYVEEFDFDLSYYMNECEKCKECIDGYAAYNVIGREDEKNVLLYNMYYLNEELGIQDSKRIVPVADNVKIYSYNLDIVVGSNGLIEKHICSCEENDSVNTENKEGFVFYNADGEISKIIYLELKEEIKPEK